MTKSLMPDIDRVKSLSNYLLAIEGDVKRYCVATMFEYAMGVFPGINRNYRVNCDYPQIRVSSNMEIDAQSMEGMIEVSEGLVNHCLALKFSDLNEILERDPPAFFLDPMFVAQASLTWVMAHEYFHIVRGHTSLLLAHGEDIDIQHATERDADLCALAVVFRINQRAMGSLMSMLEIRKLTLYLIFWILRTFPRRECQSTHPSFVVRLWYFVGKLAIITETDGYDQTPDVNGELPQTYENAEALAKCLVLCEQTFLKIYGKEYGAMLPELREVLNLGVGRDAIKRWDAIRPQPAGRRNW